VWINGRTALYVIGSFKVFSPMGCEIFPFNSFKEAEDFAENGGNTVNFDDVTIYKLKISFLIVDK
jgi:nitrous oxide reductase accessory protein NosL